MRYSHLGDSVSIEDSPERIKLLCTQILPPQVKRARVVDRRDIEGKGCQMERECPNDMFAPNIVGSRGCDDIACDAPLLEPVDETSVPGYDDCVVCRHDSPRFVQDVIII